MTRSIQDHNALHSRSNNKEYAFALWHTCFIQVFFTTVPRDLEFAAGLCPSLLWGVGTGGGS